MTDHAEASAVPNFRFADNLVNFVSSLGTARDPTTNASYSFRELDRFTLESAYRSDWIAQAVIDAPAEDATKKWRNWKASKNQIGALEKVEKALRLRMKVKQWIVRARLYGGAALLIGVDDGRESWEEIDLDAVEKGALKFVVVLNRYELMAGPRIYNVSSIWYPRPEYYTVATPLFGFYGEEGTAAPGQTYGQPLTRWSQGQSPPQAGGGQRGNVVPFGRGPAGGRGDPYRQLTPYAGMVRVHPSRVMELAGHDLPDWRLAPTGGGWGDSVLQVVDEALRDWGTTVGSIANMTNDAKIDIIKIKDFTQRIVNPEYKSALLNRWMASNITKSTINALLLDSEEEWQRTQTSFSGLAELMREFMVVIAGAAKIPISRLFGQSAGRGLGAGASGGEQDLENYYDSTSSWQETTVTPSMEMLDQVLVRSTLGSAATDVWYEWAPLWQMTDQEKAVVAKSKAEVWQIDVQQGLINEDVLRKARISQLIEDGTYPGLEDAIDEFGEEPDVPVSRVWSPGIDPVTGEPLGGTPPGGGFGGGGAFGKGGSPRPPVAVVPQVPPLQAKTAQQAKDAGGEDEPRDPQGRLDCADHPRVPRGHPVAGRWTSRGEKAARRQHEAVLEGDADDDLEARLGDAFDPSEARDSSSKWSDDSAAPNAVAVEGQS